MYIFVRFSAIVTIFFGVLLMLTGAGGALYGFFQNDAVTRFINDWLEQMNSLYRVLNAGYLGVIAGTILFLIGMFTSAMGQLLIVFADLAANTRETNVLLRNMRSRPIAAVRPGVANETTANPQASSIESQANPQTESAKFFDEEEAYG
jgi:UPF0716 family protein affecting phage T7 exclusion